MMYNYMPMGIIGLLVASVLLMLTVGAVFLLGAIALSFFWSLIKDKFGA